MRNTGVIYPSTGKGVEYNYIDSVKAGTLSAYDRDAGVWLNFYIMSNVTNFRTLGTDVIKIDNDGSLKPTAAATRNLGSAVLDWHEVFARHLTDTGADEIEQEMIQSGKKALDYTLTMQKDGRLNINNSAKSVFERRTFDVYEHPQNTTDQGRIIGAETRVLADVGEGVVLAQLQITELKEEMEKMKLELEALKKR
jgi:hypothetical protein